MVATSVKMKTYLIRVFHTYHFPPIKILKFSISYLVIIHLFPDFYLHHLAPYWFSWFSLTNLLEMKPNQMKMDFLQIAWRHQIQKTNLLTRVEKHTFNMIHIMRETFSVHFSWIEWIPVQWLSSIHSPRKLEAPRPHRPDWSETEKGLCYTRRKLCRELQ